MIQTWSADEPWPDGSRELLLVGPPGTGKTRSVLESYVWPALRDGQRVLATSFTRAAAMELRARTADALGGDPEDWRSQLSTIHSEASRRCAAMRFRFGGESKDSKRSPDDRDSAPTEIGTGDWLRAIEAQGERSSQQSWDYVRQVWPQDIGQPPRERLARMLSGTRLDEAAAFATGELHKQMSDGVLVKPDFTALLEAALTDGADIGLDLLAIDEAQDLTPLQWALVDKWARSARRLLIVGDPDQAIYGWAGADGARLLRWIRSGRTTRRLAQSWRVPAAVHGLARRIVLQVQDREDAPYKPATHDGAVDLWGNDIEAAAEAAGEQGRGGKVMVLSRTGKGLGPMIDALTAAGVPHFSERLRSAMGHGPDQLSRAFKVARALTDWAWLDRPALHSDAKVLVDALSTKGPLLAESPRGTKTKLQKLLQSRRGQPVALSALALAGLDDRALVEAWKRPTRRWWADAVLASGQGVSSEEVMLLRDWLVAYEGDHAALIEAADRVRLTTAHGSKGREAGLVILDARARMDVRPRPDDSDIRGLPERRDEDLRVLYVAVTRAKQRLMVIRGERDWLGAYDL